MAPSAYLRLTGKSQGSIDGPVTLGGREDTIEVFGWNHEIVSNLDPASGSARGKRQHKAITITKPIDRTTPLLIRAFVTGEMFPFWKLEIWQTGEDGMASCHYRIELENAIISGIAQEQLNNQHPENTEIGVREHVSFVYQGIGWTWIETGASAKDSWAARG